MDSYLDTSFLLKLYLPEPESRWVADWVNERWGRGQVSSLTDLEMTTVLCREDSAVVGVRNVDDYRQDCGYGAFNKVMLDAEVFSEAERIAEGLSRQFGLRSLDVLHLAITVRHGIPSMGTYDRRLRTAAQALGLAVLPA